MDPNETLRRLRQLLDPAHGSRRLLGANEYADEVTELIRALDERLTGGGSPPEDWAPMATHRAAPATTPESETVDAITVLEGKDEYVGRTIGFTVGNLVVRGTLVSIWERGYFNHPNERLMVILENNHQYRVGYRTPIVVEPKA